MEPKVHHLLERNSAWAALDALCPFEDYNPPGRALQDLLNRLLELRQTWKEDQDGEQADGEQHRPQAMILLSTNIGECLRRHLDVLVVVLVVVRVMVVMERS